MNRIAQFSEDIMNCRFCWMCRQVCTVGRLTRDETQSPRSRALLLASIEKGMFGYSEEISEVMYKCCLCGYCLNDNQIGAHRDNEIGDHLGLHSGS